LANIYLARDMDSTEQVVIKRFHHHLYEESLESFLRELEHLSQLDHPNILPVLDWSGQVGVGGDTFLVLPYMEMGNLRSLLQGRKFCPPMVLLPLIREAAAGLDHAHAAGIIHGDIKPENILIGGVPRAARLADFGVARHFVVEDMVATATRAITKPQGASAYLSPEQLREDESSPRSDLYSFALVVYELLTGRLPYDIRAPLFVQLKARVDGNLVPPQQANDQLNEPICAALMRALDLDPAKRPGSAGAFARALEQVPKKWDIFIAHAGGDLAPAKTLLGLLDTRVKVFLDDARLQLGDNWDIELAAAQRDSLVTVVLVSNRAEAAFYQREEIAAAIQMARNDPQSHRVVPIYLDAESAARPPYGLTIKHGLRLEHSDDLTTIAPRLVDLVRGLKSTA
jgi:hypothetical protein